MFTDVKTLFIDAANEETAGLARYMNDDHRKPNAKAVKYVDSSETFYRWNYQISLKSHLFFSSGGVPQVQFVAIRNICKDEEVSYDYKGLDLTCRTIGYFQSISFDSISKLIYISSRWSMCCFEQEQESQNSCQNSTRN